MGGKCLANDEEIEPEVRDMSETKKTFYPAGFDALVKRRDKCISVGGGHVEN
jgi:hypothetical protein